MHHQLPQFRQQPRLRHRSTCRDPFCPFIPDARSPPSAHFVDVGHLQRITSCSLIRKPHAYAHRLQQHKLTPWLRCPTSARPLTCHTYSTVAATSSASCHKSSISTTLSVRASVVPKKKARPDTIWLNWLSQELFCRHQIPPHGTHARPRFSSVRPAIAWKCLASLRTASPRTPPPSAANNFRTCRSSINRSRNALALKASHSRKKTRRVKSSVSARSQKEKPRRYFQRRGRDWLTRELTTAERFSSTGIRQKNFCLCLLPITGILSIPRFSLTQM